MVNPKSAVLLFIGKDEYLKKKALDGLRSSFFSGCSGGDTDYKVFDGRETETRHILEYVTTMPFLAARRLAVIKDFDALPAESKSRIVEYIKKPSKTALLVIEAKDESLLNKHPEIREYTNVNIFESPKEGEIYSWIKRFIDSGAAGKSITPEAVEDLKGLRGPDLLSLKHEIDKLIAFVGDRAEVTAGDIRHVVGNNAAVSAFDIAQAIEAKDVDMALGIISGLVLSGKKHHEIIGLLTWHFKRILRAKLMSALGTSESYIAGRLNVYRRYQDDFFRQVRAVDVETIRSRMNVLLEADIDIKKSKFDTSLILEFALIRLCLG